MEPPAVAADLGVAITSPHHVETLYVSDRKSDADTEIIRHTPHDHTQAGPTTRSMTKPAEEIEQPRMDSVSTTPPAILDYSLPSPPSLTRECHATLWPPLDIVTLCLVQELSHRLYSLIICPRTLTPILATQDTSVLAWDASTDIVVINQHLTRKFTRLSVCIGAESVLSICVVSVWTEVFMFGIVGYLKNDPKRNMTDCVPIRPSDVCVYIVSSCASITVWWTIVTIVITWTELKPVSRYPELL